MKFYILLIDRNTIDWYFVFQLLTEIQLIDILNFIYWQKYNWLIFYISIIDMNAIDWNSVVNISAIKLQYEYRKNDCKFLPIVSMVHIGFGLFITVTGIRSMTVNSDWLYCYALKNEENKKCLR